MIPASPGRKNLLIKELHIPFTETEVPVARDQA